MLQPINLALVLAANISFAAPAPVPVPVPMSGLMKDNPLKTHFAIVTDCVGVKCQVDGVDYDCTHGTTCHDGGHCGGPDVDSLTCE